MANDRIGPVPIPSTRSGNRGAWGYYKYLPGVTYDGTLCTGEVFSVDQDTGVASRWDGSTSFPAGVTINMNNLVDASGDPVELGSAPADGQHVTACIFGVVGIKHACGSDDIVIGTPFKGAANGQVSEASATDATGQDKAIALLLDFQAKNAGGGTFGWFFYTGYVLNTNKVA